MGLYDNSICPVNSEQRAEVSDQLSVNRGQLSGLLFTVHRLLFTAHRLLFLFLLKDRVYDIEIIEGDSPPYDP